MMKIDHSVKIGIAFGITSGIITTMGLMIGLSSGTSSKLAVLGGIFTIAIADAFSDALGIHVSEESEGVHTPKEIWTATGSTFLAKLVFSLTFSIAVMLLPLKTAVITNIIWGLFALSVLTIVIAKNQKESVKGALFEHIGTAILVIGASFGVGELIAKYFS